MCALKCCLDEGLTPTCFERSGDIGGLWRFEVSTMLYRVALGSSADRIAYCQLMKHRWDFPLVQNGMLVVQDWSCLRNHCWGQLSAQGLLSCLRVNVSHPSLPSLSCSHLSFPLVPPAPPPPAAPLLLALLSYPSQPLLSLKVLAAPHPLPLLPPTHRHRPLPLFSLPRESPRACFCTRQVMPVSSSPEEPTWHAPLPCPAFAMSMTTWEMQGLAWGLGLLG